LAAEQGGGERRRLLLEASRYYWVTRRMRAGMVAAGFLAIAVSAAVLITAVEPLYRYQGGYIVGYLGLSRYQLRVFGSPVRAAVLDSLTLLSFSLYVGSLLAAALTLPSLYHAFRGPRTPRIALESAVAGYTIAALTLALLVSFLRVLYDDILPHIPTGAQVPTPYGRFAVEQSSAWYTGAGIYAIRLRLYSPFLVAALLAAAALLYYSILRYYWELEDSLIYGHNS
jgi:hypothetical protein